jgi:sporulation protein YlmC with PRC-barrel domain
MALVTILGFSLLGGVAAQDPAKPAPGVKEEAGRSGLTREFRAVKASQLKGLNILNRKDEKIGDLEDLVIDEARQRVAYAVIGAGGVVGIGEDHLAVPFRVLDFNFADGKLKNATLDSEKDRLKDAPKLERKDWKNKVSDRGWQQRVNEYYRVRRPATGQDAAPSFIKASEVVGTNVKNLEGKSLGEIKDLMVELDDGYIAYAALSFGGFLGLGDKLFAVPLKSLMSRDDGKAFVLDVDKEKLQNAPGFDEKNWPERIDPQWLGTVYRFYSVVPAWEADEPRDLSRQAARLPLKLQKGDSFRYRVSVDRNEKDSPGSERGGTTATFTRKECDIDLLVKESSEAGGKAIQVTVSPVAGIAPAAAPGGRPTACTVMVDQNGKVMRTEGFEAAGAAGAPGKEPGQKAETHAGSILSGPHLLAQVQCILGSGLHEEMLQPGQTYDAGKMKSPPPGSPGSPQRQEGKDLGESPRPGGTAEGKEPTAPGGQDAPGRYHPEGMRGEWGITLDQLKLRFEGTTSETAYFAIVTTGPGLAPASGRPAEAQARTPGEERGEAATAQPGTARDHDRIGKAVYNTDDGLLDMLRVRLEAHEKPFKTPSTDNPTERPAGRDAGTAGERNVAPNLHIVIRRR